MVISLTTWWWSGWWSGLWSGWWSGWWGRGLSEWQRRQVMTTVLPARLCGKKRSASVFAFRYHGNSHGCAHGECVLSLSFHQKMDNERFLTAGTQKRGELNFFCCRRIPHCLSANEARVGSLHLLLHERMVCWEGAHKKTQNLTHPITRRILCRGQRCFCGSSIQVCHLFHVCLGVSMTGLQNS